MEETATDDGEAAGPQLICLAVGRRNRTCQGCTGVEFCVLALFKYAFRIQPAVNKRKLFKQYRIPKASAGNVPS